MIQTPKGFATSLPVKHVTPRLATRIAPQRYSPSAPSVARTLGSNSASNHELFAHPGWLRTAERGRGQQPTGTHSLHGDTAPMAERRVGYSVRSNVRSGWNTEQ